MVNALSGRTIYTVHSSTTPFKFRWKCKRTLDLLCSNLLCIYSSIQGNPRQGLKIVDENRKWNNIFSHYLLCVDFIYLCCNGNVICLDVHIVCLCSACMTGKWERKREKRMKKRRFLLFSFLLSKKKNKLGKE